MTESPYAMQVRSGDVWITVRGGDYDEFYNNAAVLFGARTDDLIGAAAAPQSTGQAVHNASAGGLTPPPPPAPPGGSPGVAPPPPPPPPPAPAAAAPQTVSDWKSNPPLCAHGKPRRPQEWTRKTDNEVQYTYFCSEPRDVPREQKCQPIDAVTGKEWK